MSVARQFFGIVAAEARLQLRSPGAWIAGLLALAYTICPARTALTYLDLSVSIGEVLVSLVGFALALTWVTAAQRAGQNQTHELVESSWMPLSVRLAAEFYGSLVVALGVVGFVILVNLVIFLIQGRGGFLVDLWQIALVAGPGLFAWAGLSRLLARLLPPAGGYVALLALWALGTWQRASLFALNYMPERAFSQLTLLGVEAGRSLIWHRVALLAVGLVAASLGCLPAGRDRRGFARSVMAVSGAAIVVGVAAIPGVASLLASGVEPATAEAWAERAKDGHRWASVQPEEGTGLFLPTDAVWAADTFDTFRRLMVLDGGELPEGVTVTEAPVESLAMSGDILVVPERTFRGVESVDQLKRRLITEWVKLSTGPSEGLVDAKDGERLYREWRYAESLLGREAVLSEIDKWRSELERLAAGRRSEPGGGLPTGPRYLGELSHWRGERAAVSSLALKEAARLWDEAEAAR